MTESFKIDKFSEKVRTPYDIFICSSSFEERCLSIPRKVSENRRASQAIIFKTGDSAEHVEVNFAMLQELFPGCCDKVEVFLTDPIKSADNISEEFDSKWDRESSAEVLIDITTFTHETLLMVLAAMRRDYPKLKISCCYVNASEYAWDEPEQQKKWLSRGLRNEVRTILGYAGNMVPSKKTHLIVIVGYEYERAVQIIESMEPDAISLGYGGPTDAVTEKNKEANEQFARLVRKVTVYYEDIPDFVIPCDNPYELRDRLLHKIEEIGNNYNIIIIPMNNKISTVGVALACQKRPDIQLCYAPARVYNYQYYSKAGRNCYLFSLSEGE